ncbi:hypothetical protein [Thermoflexus sp.]|uniref:hypothetical protein n=1 Tax=Thermoflexus sp. TaxID=1969742 RepID=UPI0025F6DE51|nr:hypothetical protein [Thermoflexus sp.]MCS6964381.1 hypothetical protein [Thermoflexus sp.]MCX7689399.1 hypothetical protein [Thermoflexus sp.]MDW8185093.1 hypothetical protein [Anaerolineae bacterium]
MDAQGKELQELLDTIDVLRLIAMKGRTEARHFAGYMIAFGLYPAFNIFLDLLTGHTLWLPTLYVAFFGATAPIAGGPAALAIWGAAGALAGGIWELTRSGGWTLGTILLTVPAAIMGVYAIGLRRGRLEGMPPLRVAIAPRIGWAWGVIMGGMAVLTAGLGQAPLPPGAVTALWGYAIGVGLFVSGAIFPTLFPLGLIGIFGVPFLSLFAGQQDLAYGLIGLLGLSMAGAGIREWRAHRA